VLTWLVAAALLAEGCGNAGRESPPQEGLLVLASILPLANFARQVGGERVRVEALVPPGASPHTYELTPAQLRAVSQARLMILNGVGLEYWAEQVISAADNPELAVVNTSQGIRILSGDPDDPGGNPHVWLNPRNAMRQVAVIRDALVRIDPAGVEDYRHNTEQFLGELERLDREIREAANQFTAKQIVTFHAAWSYFAGEYGLVEAAVVERSPGREPSPDEMAEVIRTARMIGARAIFAEPQFSPRAAETIAEESGAQVLFLNPLGFPPDYSYLAMMRYNLAEISKALR